MTKGKIVQPSGTEGPSSRETGMNMPSPKDMAKIGLDPLALASRLTLLFSKGSSGDLSHPETYGLMLDHVDRSEAGDQSDERAMLIGQSHALNAIFAEMARRAANNMGQSFEGMERYLRLAFKAQAQCRATIEALDRLENGHEQTVRHIHVDNRGGQAVITDNIQTGGRKLAKSTNNPLQPEKLAVARRCLAKTRSGTPCQSPAIKGKVRCRMHGGKNPGAPVGNSNAMKHGARSATVRALSGVLRKLAQSAPDDDWPLD